MKKPVAAAAVPYLLLLLLFTACSNDLGFTVQFKQAEGIKKGDSVLWRGNRIGKVKGVTYTKDGVFAVKLSIDESFRNAATDAERFVITEDPAGGGAKAVEMVDVRPGGVPLADGAVVNGSGKWEAWGEALQRKWDDFLRDLSDVPKEEWAKDLKKQMNELGEELKNAGEQTRKKLKEDVLPQMEKNLEELKKWLKQQGREKESKPLDDQMKEIKSI